MKEATKMTTLQIIGMIAFAIFLFVLLMESDTLAYGEGFVFWKKKLVATGKHAGEERIRWNWPGTQAFLQCLGATLVTTAVKTLCATVTMPWWIPLIMLVVMLALIVNMLIWWILRERVRFWDWLLSATIIGIFTSVAMEPAGLLAKAIASPFWASVVAQLPTIVSAVVAGYILVSFLFYLSRTTDHPTLFTVLGWIFLVLAAIGLVLTLIFGLNWPKKSTAPTPAPQPTQTAAPAPTVTWHWYHDAVILDNYDANGNQLTGEALAEALLNDYNFGTDLVNEVVMHKIASGAITYGDLIDCKTQSDLIKFVTVDEVKEVMYERLRNDPTYLAATCLWWDVKFHTNHLGEFIVTLEDEHAEDAMELVNYAAAWWTERPDAFYEAAERFIEEMEHSNEIRLRYVASGITDQMYMDGIWPGQRPTIIVMESPDQYGWVIEFVRYIKPNANTNNAVVAGFRTACGGQAYNVAKELDVTPAANPTTPSPAKNGGGTPPAQNNGGGNQPQQDGGGTPTTPSNGGGNPPTSNNGGGTPPITKPKDPTKGSDSDEDVIPNDDPGITGDPPTMDPSDPWHSSEDKLPTNSGNGMTTPQYFDLVDGAAEANEIANRHDDGPDPSTGHYTPTYTPTPQEQANGGVEVHSNDDTGKNGIGGGLDVFAPVDVPASGAVVDESGEDTAQTGDVSQTVQSHWDGDMSG